MRTEIYTYRHGDQELQGFLAMQKQTQGKRPAVLVVHDWTGRNEFAGQQAQQLAKLGYLGFAVDMYGDGRLGETVEEKQALMNPLLSDRALLRDRMLAAYHVLLELPEVDPNRIAVMGFCFGGLCALDLARSGVNLAGAISFHGLLGKPEGLSKESIQAKILVLHGYEDPMVSPSDVNVFCEEMTEAQADWQVHLYGKTKHAFTNPLANDVDMGTVFNAQSARRAMHSMTTFLEEIFG